MFTIEIKDNQEEENEISHYPKFLNMELSFMTYPRTKRKSWLLNFRSQYKCKYNYGKTKYQTIIQN